MENEIIIKGTEFYIKRDSLKEVNVDKTNWNVYYIDERTKEKWVEEYLYPEMQAGGPPQLRLIESFPWD